MKNFSRILALTLLATFWNSITAQLVLEEDLAFLESTAISKIEIKNPSFELPLFDSKLLPLTSTWQDCGTVEFPKETPVTIHQEGSFLFNVEQEPHDGNTYIGMVTRANESWESISQELVEPLKKDAKYFFRVYVSTSNQLKSPMAIGQSNIEAVYYNEPTVIRIYGGNSSCSDKTKLFESNPVLNIDWEPLHVKFST